MKKRITLALLTLSLLVLFPITASATNNGWVLESNLWSYYQNDVPITGWAEIDGTWYYFNDYGIMQTGWLNLNGTRYYLYDTGSMATGWLQLNSYEWYYLYDSGALATGWLNLNGTWYYLDENTGEMFFGAANIHGTGYAFDWDGAMLTGWVHYADGSWRYYNSDGAEQLGWFYYNNNWYYLDAAWGMLTGMQWVESTDGPPHGILYYFDDNGAMVTNSWIYAYEVGYDSSAIDTTFPGYWWFYFGSNGNAQSGWIYDNRNWYYCIGQYYNMQTGWVDIDGSWYYFHANGALAS